MSDAFSLQSIASLILIYFANITLAFTFGAILRDNTNMTLVCVMGVVSVCRGVENINRVVDVVSSFDIAGVCGVWLTHYLIFLG